MFYEAFEVRRIKCLVIFRIDFEVSKYHVWKLSQCRVARIEGFDVNFGFKVKYEHELNWLYCILAALKWQSEISVKTLAAKSEKFFTPVYSVFTPSMDQCRYEIVSALNNLILR